MLHRRFGAYLAEPPRSSGKDYYGNGETFVFTFNKGRGEQVEDDTTRNRDNYTVTPKEMQVVKVFPWTKDSNR